MTKPLDPEIKALRGVVRALEPLEQERRARVLEWTVARYLNARFLPPLPFTDPRRKTAA